MLKAIAGLSAELRPASVTEAVTQVVERRQLTVMFVDLANSTELSRRLGPEEMQTKLGTGAADCTAA